MFMTILSSSVLILLLLCLRPFMKKRFSPVAQYALWGLVALRLLIPVQLWQSPLSLENFTQTTPAPIVEPQENLANGIFQSHPSESNPQENAINVDNISQNTAVSRPSTAVPDTQMTPSVQTIPSVQTVTPQVASLTTEEVLNSVWFAGCLAMALWFLCLNVGFTRKARQGARRLESPETTIPVYESEHIPSPCLVGLVKPRIYMLPCGDPSAQRHILAHEQTHYRHWDHIWSLVRILCLCIHWFNPLVWVAAYLSKEDCEAACDQGSIAVLGEEERIPYGKTLLDTLTRVKLPANLLRSATTMGGGKAQIRKRMERIVSKPKKALWAILILVVALSLCVGCTFTGATDSDVPEQSENALEQMERYDFDLFSMELPQGSQKGNSLNANNVQSFSYAGVGYIWNRRIGVECVFVPKREPLSAFADRSYKVDGGTGDITVSAAGNLCYEFPVPNSTSGYAICFEAGEYQVRLYFCARDSDYERYLPYFEEWEKSIVINDEPTGTVLSELWRWETDDIEIKVPKSFYALDTSEVDLALKNTQEVGIGIFSVATENTEGMNAQARLLKYFQNIVSEETIRFNAAGRPTCAVSYSDLDETSYYVWVETPEKDVVVEFWAPTELYEEYWPLFDEWASTIVVKDSFGVRVVDYVNEGNLRIPQFTSESNYCKKANNKILELLENNYKYKSIDYSVNRVMWYDESSNKEIDVLSLLISAVTVDGETVHDAYNVDVQSGYGVVLTNIATQAKLEMIAHELYHRYDEKTGRLPYTAEDHAIVLQNLNHTNSEEGDLSRDTVYWLTADGRIASSFLFYPLNGGEPYRINTEFPDICMCAAEDIVDVVELYSYTTEGEVNHIPFVVMNSSRADQINAQILRNYGQKAIGTTFSWSIHDEILSLAVHGQHGLIYHEMHHVYTLSTRTFGDASRAEVLAAAGMTEEEYNAVAGEMFEDQTFHLFPVDDYRITVPRDVIFKSGTPENVADSIPYLEKDGSLWALARIYQIAGSESNRYTVPITNHQFTEQYRAFLKDAEGYPCEIWDCSDPSATYGKAVLHLPLWQTTWLVKEVQVIQCEDGCEPSALVSRAAYGNAPVYVPKLQKELDGNYHIYQYRMSIPQPMVADLKDSGDYDAVVAELDRNAYFLFAIDDTHYAYLHLERNKDGEYAMLTAQGLVKGVTIVME